MKNLLILVSISLLACCSNNKNKINDPKVLGKQIFELLKKGDREAISNYFITNSDVNIAFAKSPFYEKLTPKEKTDFTISLLERQEKEFNMFLDMYIDDEDIKETKALKAGVYNNTTIEELQENVMPVTKIYNNFTFNNTKNYNLILKSIKVGSHFELLSWIEVKPIN